MAGTPNIWNPNGSTFPIILTKLIVNVKDFGARGDGVTDDTVAMQFAHNTGAIVYYPTGTYVFTKISMLSGGIIGDGIHATQLYSLDNTTADVITHSGADSNGSTGVIGYIANGPTFRDFFLTSPSKTFKTAGAGISINPNPLANSLHFADIQNINVRNFPSGLNMLGQSMFKIRNCEIFFYSIDGIHVENALNTDQGDSHIEGCQFYNGGSVLGNAIKQLSSGGLRIINNKFNGGAYHYNLDVQGGTSDVIIVGNSSENAGVCSLQFGRSTGAALFGGNIVIGSNQFANNKADIYFDASGLWTVISICGNTFKNPKYAGISSVQLDSGSSFAISGNSWYSNQGSVKAITIGAPCTLGRIGSNNYSGCTVVNNGGLTVLVAPDVQIGTGVAVTNNPYGSLFIGQIAVVFPYPFAAVPQVTSALDSFVGIASGGVSALVANVTATGFVAWIIGLTNGGSVNFTWRAEGILQGH